MINVKNHAGADADTARAAPVTVALENVISNLGRDPGALIGRAKYLPATDIDAQFGALVADVHIGPSDQFAYIVLRLGAE